MPDALNIPKNKPQFDAVPFVDDMTQHQLKVMIKRIWINIQAIATKLDDSRPDVANLLDMLLDGQKLNVNGIRDTAQYFQINNNLVQYDAKNNTITVIDSNGKIVLENITGHDYKTIKSIINKRNK